MRKTLNKLILLCLCLTMVGGMFAGCLNKREKFIVGGTGPLTGTAASYGISVQRGAQIAIDEINAAGGLNGVEFELQLLDDEAKSDKVTAAYDNLIKKGMVVSIGSVTSGAGAQFASLAKEDNLFFMTPSASSDDVIKESNAYRICFGDPDQGVVAAEKLLESYTNIGIIYDSDDAYSKGIYDALIAEFEELDFTDYTAKTFGGSKESFATQVGDLKAAGCDVIFLPIYYQEAALIIREANTQSYEVDFFGCDGLDGLKKYAAGDATLTSLLSRVTYLTPFDAENTDSKVVSFVNKYKAAYNEIPDQFAADGYDAVMSIYEAMKKADIKDVNISISDLCEELKVVFQSNDFSYNGLTGNMKWNASGAAEKEFKVVNLG